MKNKLLFFLLVSFLGMFQIWGQTLTATYTVSNTTTVSSSGTLPSGSSATYAQTYNTASQLTSGNNATLTLNGYAGKKISQIILSMRSNTSSGAGNLDMGAGTGTYPTGYTTIYSIATAPFNNAVWNGAWSTSYTNLTKTLATAYTVQTNEKVVIRINATTNSLYIASFSIVYENPITDYYWDTSTASGLGGSATWGTTFSTSTTGNTALVVAPSTAATIFQGTAGTITLAANQTVASSTFNVDGYTIATSGSGARTLAGTINLTTRNITVSPIAASGLTISGVISGTGAASSTIFTKNGAGTLTLSSSGNTFTGKVLINDGYIATTGESRFGANPDAFTADQITINGGGISAVSGDISFTSNRGIRLNSSGGKFNPSSGRTITLTNVVSGTGDLIKEGAGTVTLSGAHTYTGNTNVTAGTLQLASAERIANTSNLILNGGTFRTGSSTGYAETVGTLELKANSTITLGTGNHSLVFSNSSGITWDGTALTITGWTGTEGNSGTAGKIFVGNDASGLSAAQLAKITFSGYTNGTMILPTGEVVPGLNTAPYFEIESITNTAFGSVCVNSTAATDGVFDLYGFNLTSDATVGPLDGFTFSIDETTFTNSLTLSPSAGDLAETIRIRFTPTAAQSYNGSVPVDGGGVAVASSVAVTGTGNANNTPSVNIAITTGTNPECSGGTVVFTATQANIGGGNVAYQWKLNGENTGMNSPNYTNSTLADNDIVSCEITITGGTCMNATNATSNEITMTVNTTPAIVSIKPASGGPAGTLVTITGTGFTPGSAVKFGTIDATDIQIISLTEIQAVVPDGAVSNTIEVSTALSCPAASTFTIINQDASGCN
ncbi:autotransporter-associated beta strand protein [Flavobacterium arsenatis]|uniref:Autotransporter-associated beta strand protein n=1 Tax=Flavobacterium arsenatis TaxID=1484332 RepID=A0ABU1TLC0_9FLAO|nr:autotransporter-associated beta strand repeat-containing protein [Flavobacterium arsenatis]MDR6966759.1 autotransporter-associated beta strand protein [Flavobacterium arsenatis]